MENNKASTSILPQLKMEPGFEVKTTDSMGKVTDCISISHCMFCTEKIKQSKNSADKTSYLNFENGIKSLCALFSLQENYLHDELKVSSVLLLASLCSNCVEKLVLISEYFGEIERIRTELERLKTSIEKDLSRESSKETDLDREQTVFRKRLQKKLNIFHPSALASVLKRASAPSEDDANLGHIDADSFFSTETKVDVYSEAQDDLLLEEDGIEQLIAEPEVLWTEYASELRPTTVQSRSDQNSFTQFEEATGEKNELNSNHKLLRSGSRVTFTAFDSNSDSEAESETESKPSLKPRITPSTNSPLRWKPEPKLSPEELNLVENADLKDCSIVVPRLLVPKGSRLAKGKSAKNILTCEHCFKVCKEDSHLLYHKTIAHPEKLPFMCVECNRGFRKETIYQRHLEFHASNLKHCCPVCNAEFEKRRDFVKHRKTHPFKVHLKKCEDCGKGFNNRNELLSHQRKHHGLPYPYTCSYCQKGFNRPEHLRLHEVNHTGERNFKCEQCPTTFASQIALDRHVLDSHVKHVERVFTCELCARSYKRKGDLTLHMRTHTGDRPFVCDLCGMAFVFKNHLTSHLALHKDERPFLCSECGFSFRSKRNLTAHQKIHEKHRKLRESAQKSGLQAVKLPVSRLAKPRNRILGFTRTYFKRPGTAPAIPIMPEVNSTEVSDPSESSTASDRQEEMLWNQFEQSHSY